MDRGEDPVEVDDVAFYESAKSSQHKSQTVNDTEFEKLNLDEHDPNQQHVQRDNSESENSMQSSINQRLDAKHVENVDQSEQIDNRDQTDEFGHQAQQSHDLLGFGESENDSVQQEALQDGLLDFEQHVPQNENATDGNDLMGNLLGFDRQNGDYNSNGPQSNTDSQGISQGAGDAIDSAEPISTDQLDSGETLLDFGNSEEESNNLLGASDLLDMGQNGAENEDLSTTNHLLDLGAESKQTDDFGPTAGIRQQDDSTIKDEDGFETSKGSNPTTENDFGFAENQMPSSVQHDNKLVGKKDSLEEEEYLSAHEHSEEGDTKFVDASVEEQEESGASVQGQDVSSDNVEQEDVFFEEQEGNKTKEGEEVCSKSVEQEDGFVEEQGGGEVCSENVEQEDAFVEEQEIQAQEVCSKNGDVSENVEKEDEEQEGKVGEEVCSKTGNEEHDGANVQAPREEIDAKIEEQEGNKMYSENVEVSEKEDEQKRGSEGNVEDVGKEKNRAVGSARSLQSGSTRSLVSSKLTLYPDDIVINDALLQLQLLLMLRASMELRVGWARSTSVQNKLVRQGFKQSYVGDIQKLSRPDVQDGIAELLHYITFLAKEKNASIVGAVCKMFLRVRDESLAIDVAKNNSVKVKGLAKFSSEEGVRSEEVLFETLNDVLVRLPPPPVLVEAVEETNKLADVAFSYFADHHQSGDPRLVGITVKLIGNLSPFALKCTLGNFGARMGKVYFQASALEYLPFMKVCTTQIKYDVCSSSSTEAVGEFLGSITKLLQTTACAELITEVFQCVAQICSSLIERGLPEGFGSQGGDSLGDGLENIFGLAYGYCSKKKYVASSLLAMEAIVSWQQFSSGVMFYSSLESQEERLCKELLKRVKDKTTRISGLDHLGRFMKNIPVDVLLDKSSDTQERKTFGSIIGRLGSLSELLFLPGDIPRAQEAALLSAIVEQVGIHDMDQAFGDLVAVGLESDKATSAQRAVVLTALSGVGRFLKENVRVDEEGGNVRSPLLQSFVRKYAKFAVFFAGREHPVVVVAAALDCFPILGESSQTVLQHAVDNAFCYDVTLVEAARSALIRYCQLGCSFAEKVVMVVIETPNLRLISTNQANPKLRQDTAQIIGSIGTLEMILEAALDKGFDSPDLIAAAGSTLLLASTYPDAKVNRLALLALRRLNTEGKKVEEQIYLERTVDKLVLGLLGSSGSSGEPTCGGSVCLSVRNELDRQAEFADTLSWWQTQCTLICSVAIAQGNRPAFVRALVREYLTTKDTALQTSILVALSRLVDLHDVVEKELAVQASQTSLDCFNEKRVLLLSAFHETYAHGALDARILRAVSIWIQKWSGEEAKLLVRGWSKSTVDGAAYLLKSFVERRELEKYEEPDAMRDQAVFLIRDWCRARERIARTTNIAEAFIAILESGHLKSMEAQTYALKMLSAFSGFKGYQAKGLRALLYQNMNEMVGHYFETILRSFDPGRWSNEKGSSTVTVSGEDRHPFINHVTLAILNCLDENINMMPTMIIPQMVIVICLLFTHDIPDIRLTVNKWVQTSSFLGLPNDQLPSSYFSSKIGGLTKSMFLSKYLAKNSRVVSISSLFAAAGRLSNYLTESQVSHLVQNLEPWLSERFPGETEEPARLIARLLRLCLRLQNGMVLPWRTWRSVEISTSTVNAIVDWMIENDSLSDYRSPLMAINQISLECAERQETETNHVFKLLVEALPELSWTHPEVEGRMTRAGSGSRSIITVDAEKKRIRAVLSLMANAPFLLNNFENADMARTLAVLFIEEGIESSLAQRTLESITGELSGVPPTELDSFREEKDGYYSAIQMHNSETIAGLALHACSCALYSQDPALRKRAIQLLRHITLDSVNLVEKRDLVTRIGLRCKSEFASLSKRFSIKPKHIESLEHCLLLLELVAEGSVLDAEITTACVEIAKVLLAIPVVSRNNIMIRTTVSSLGVVSLLSRRDERLRENLASDSLFHQHLVSTLVHMDSCVLGAQLLKRLDSESSSLGLLLAGVCAVASFSKPVHRERRNSATEAQVGDSVGRALSNLFVSEERHRRLVDLLACAKETKQEDFVMDFVVLYLRGESELSDATILEILSFLVHLLKFSQGAWGLASVRVLSEFLKHQEVLSVCQRAREGSDVDSEEKEYAILEDITNALSASLAVWPESREYILRVMASVPVGNTSTFTFISAKSEQEEAAAKVLRDSLKQNIS
uniref:Uncharacterized protein n=2 Tax=Mucochytrium quahogii TaxID=96639 RepID=A0A7S2RVF4_9STRA